MADYKSSIENIPDEPGLSHHTDSKEAIKDHWDCVKRTQDTT